MPPWEPHLDFSRSQDAPPGGLCECPASYFPCQGLAWDHAALVGTGIAQPGRAQQGEFKTSREGEAAVSTSETTGFTGTEQGRLRLAA